MTGDVVYVRYTSHRLHDRIAQAIGYAPRDFYAWRNTGCALGTTHYLEVPAECADDVARIKGAHIVKPRGELHLAWSR